MGYELRDYLEIDAETARQQWRAILARDVPIGRRQEAFRPIEVVLCFGLFRIVDPRRFGGSNLHLLPPAVLALARTLRRPPGSLTNKMLNLSFERVHGGRTEPELFLQLSSNPQQFWSLYLTILEAARQLGLGPEQVPDLLGTAMGATLLGQEELGVQEFGQALAERRDEVETRELRQRLGDPKTERIVEQRVRLGQHRFAVAVLERFDRHCGFCGFAPRGFDSCGMLVASHVKPWAKCTDDRERLDPRNGIAACPTHDRAFDSGLLTVNGGYRIHRAPRLEARLADRVTESFFGAGTLAGSLLLGERGEGPARRYLEYHRTHVFDRAG
ncbi:MAG: HNH endonuclease [Planctomycetes bacterium]|nr:HNH endonuclease [Planctomycetota bacterium]